MGGGHGRWGLGRGIACGRPRSWCEGTWTHTGGGAQPGLRATSECPWMSLVTQQRLASQTLLAPRRKPAVSESWLLPAPVVATSIHLRLPGGGMGMRDRGSHTHPHSPQGPVTGVQTLPRRQQSKPSICIPLFSVRPVQVIHLPEFASKMAQATFGTREGH